MPHFIDSFQALLFNAGLAFFPIWVSITIFNFTWLDSYLYLTFFKIEVHKVDTVSILFPFSFNNLHLVMDDFLLKDLQGQQ
jgi:hypothetical protein